jgi:alpha-L-rhamnosidase
MWVAAFTVVDRSWKLSPERLVHETQDDIVLRPDFGLMMGFLNRSAQTNVKNRTNLWVDPFDVTKYLISTGSDGSNHVIGAIVGEGWFDPAFRHHDGNNYGSPLPQFAARLDIETNSLLATNTIVSDGTWRYYSDGPIRYSTIYNGENYNGTKRAFVLDWSKPTFGNANLSFTNYPAATNVAGTVMIAQPTDPIQMISTITPVDMWTNRDNGQFVRVFDMGQNISGWCSLSVTNTNQPSGTAVYLRHGESLRTNTGCAQIRGADVDFTSLRNAQQLETYTLTSEQQQQFQPHFTYHGFRFVQVTCPESLALFTNSISAFVIRSAVPQTGAFTCSQRDVNQLVTNIMWTLKVNLYGVETDCPQRDERQGWLGDSDAFSQTACFLMDMSSFYTKCIRDIRDDQYPPGTFAGQYSVNNPYSDQAAGDIGWSAGGVIKPWHLYQNYGDVRMLIEHYQSAQKWVSFLTNAWPTNFFNGAGTSWNGQSGDWFNGSLISFRLGTPPTWPTGNAAMDKEGVHGNCFYAYSADLLANISGVLQGDALIRGDSLAATYGSNYAFYTNLAFMVRSNFQRSATGPNPRGLVTYDATGTNVINIGNGTQGDYIYALYFNMVPDSQRSNCTYFLLNSTATSNPHPGIRYYNDAYTDPGGKPNTNHLSTGIQATGKGMLELTRNGFSTTAYELLTDYRFPSWLYQITAGGANYTGPAGDYGATTCWERWDALVSRLPGGYPTDAHSLNHFWAGAVGEWIFNKIGGLNLDSGAPAYNNFIIQPRLWAGISNAAISFLSIRGAISNSWSWTNTLALTNFTMSVVIPPNLTASIFIPSTDLSNIFESGNPATNAVGVFSFSVQATNGSTLFKIGSGTYNFTAPSISF